MPDELFQLPPSLSSRLAWLARHGLTCEQGKSGKFYRRLDDENFAIGDTAEAACEEMCAKTRLRHWSEET